MTIPMTLRPKVGAIRAGLVLAAACLTAGCAEGVQRVSLTLEKMSTEVTIVVYDSSPERARGAIMAAFSRIDEVVALADRHRPDSEISRVMASREPVPVSREIWELLHTAKAMGERTEGAFDVTVGPLLRLWKQRAKAKLLPGEPELREALELVGSDGIVLGDGTARLAKPGMMIDLGGVAKGYAVDAAVDALRKHGIRSALVNAGGDMAMIGPRPGAAGWRIGVQDPREPRSPSALVCTLLVPGCAVATSGNYQRYVEIEGKRLSHIVDPRTGWPCSQVPSVTIVAKSNAMTADMWATAASVMPTEQTLRLIEQDADLEALLITIEAHGELGFAMSKGFAALVHEWRVPEPGRGSPRGAGERGAKRT